MTTFFLFSQALVAQTKTVKSETYQDLIEKAQNLVLQKDRQQAINILTNAIRRESPRSMASNELKKTLNEIAAVFFSDKTQQLYEMAITLKRTDLNQAHQKIVEALRIEPDNDQLLLEEVRIAIGKGDCSNAEEIATKSRQQNPYFEEMNLAFAQAALCQGHVLDFQKAWDTADFKKSSYSKFWLLLGVEKQFKDKNYIKALEEANALKKVDPQYSEVEYWIWKIDQALKKKNSEAAEKYVMSCKNISAHLYRQYMMDPMLCRRLTEMDTSGSE